MLKNTKILGVKISNIDYLKALKRIDELIQKNIKSYVCVAATHLIMECLNNKHLSDGVNHANIVTPDGMPLVWISKLYGAKNIERVYGPDLMLKTCGLAQKNNYKVFLLGGNTGQSIILKNNLLAKFPELNIVDTYETPIRPLPIRQIKLIKHKINKSRANIVFVGLGCPWQELWMINNRNYLKPQVLIGVGAAFDFLSGYKNQAPKLVRNIGFEWLFRLINEPKRLWHRYLVLNIRFLFKISQQLIYDFILNRYNEKQT